MATGPRRSRLIQIAFLSAVSLAAAVAASADSLSFTTIQDPNGTGGTVVDGINNAGEMVGYYGNQGDNAFVYSNGAFTTLNLPIPSGVSCATAGSCFELPQGVNNAGAIVTALQGLWSGPQIGYIYNNGSLTTLTPSNASSLFTPLGINNSGTVVGRMITGNNLQNYYGFIYNNGTFSLVTYPGATATVLQGINNAGAMVGTYSTGPGTYSCNPLCETHYPFSSSFLEINGVFTAINFPGAVETQASGINSSGEIVGLYTDAAGNAHGFIDNGGVFTGFDFPGAAETIPVGINDSGEIVGYYDATLTSNSEGFLAIPVAPTAAPEPANGVLMAVGLIAVALVKRWRRAGNS